MKFVREQFFLAAVAQNITRLVRFLSRPITPVLPVTTESNSEKKTRQAFPRSRKGLLLTYFFNTHRRLHSEPGQCIMKERPAAEG